MNKKKFYLILMLIVFIFTCVGCSSTNKIGSTPKMEQNEGIVPVADQNNTRYISNSIDKVKNYQDLESLANASEQIFSGKCISSKPVFQNDTLYTLSKVKIKKVFTGTLAEGDIVNIIEMGGRTTVGEYVKGCNIEEKAFEVGSERLPDNYNLVVGIDGFFPLEKNEEVLLFVGDTSGFLKEFDEPLYDVIGAIDGKLYRKQEGMYSKVKPSSKDEREFDDSLLTISEDDLSKIK